MNIVTQLENLLDQERDILLSGEFDKLEKLTEQKEIMKKRLEAGNTNTAQEQLERIFEKSSKNQMLISSAQRGIQAAISQIREVAEGSFQSYSREGNRTPLTGVQTLGKRI